MKEGNLEEDAVGFCEDFPVVVDDFRDERQRNGEGEMLDVG